MNGKVMFWSCGRARKFRGENKNAEHVNAYGYRTRGYEKESWDLHPSKRTNNVRERAREEISEALLEHWEDQRDLAFITEMASHEVVTDVVIVDEAVLGKVYGRKRKQQDWLYAKACECGCVTVSRGGRLEFHRIRRQPRQLRQYRKQRHCSLQKVA